MNATYIVPECNLQELEDRIEKLNRRCKRLGLEPIAFTKSPDHVRHQVRQLQTGQEIGGPPTRLVWHKLHETCNTIGEEKERCSRLAKGTKAFLADQWTPTGVVMQWWKVEVTGQSPALNGWAFVAVLEPLQLEDGTAENFVQAIPGLECPAEFRSAVGRCDHCRAARRRNQTFVVRNESGEHKCVGRQCLKDFLGYHADPHALAVAAELMAELGMLCGCSEDEDWLGEGGGGWRHGETWDLSGFLSLTECRIRLFGWLSRGKAFEQNARGEATADHVIYMLTPPGNDAESRRRYDAFNAKHVIIDADRVKAAAALEWAKGLDAAELEASDYLRNVNLVARVGAASKKTAGVAASIMVAYAKAMEREVKRQQNAARPESNHVGEVGSRIECLEVTCERVIRREGMYGLTGIHKMHDAAGNDLVWFASGSAGFLAEGETVKVKATVKEHGEFQGRKQTVLSRVTVLTDEQVEKIATKLARKAAREAKKLMLV
jgi:hypothetical protein